jgi:hypothetical protein
MFGWPTPPVPFPWPGAGSDRGLTCRFPLRPRGAEWQIRGLGARKGNPQVCLDSEVPLLQQHNNLVVDYGVPPISKFKISPLTWTPLLTSTGAPSSSSTMYRSRGNGFTTSPPWTQTWPSCSSTTTTQWTLACPPSNSSRIPPPTRPPLLSSTRESSSSSLICPQIWDPRPHCRLGLYPTAAAQRSLRSFPGGGGARM